MPEIKQLSPTEVLNERISDHVLSHSQLSTLPKETILILLEMVDLALPAIYIAATGGNIHCKAVASKLLLLQTKLTKH